MRHFKKFLESKTLFVGESLFQKGKTSINKKSKNYSLLKFIIALLLLYFQIILTYSQDIQINKESNTLNIPKISADIQIDGLLNEPEWQLADVTQIFRIHYPKDTGLADARTTVKMMYSESNIYIGIISYETIGTPIVQTLKRDDDNNAGNNDGIIIVIDPANTAKNGYFFKVNASGAQIDGTVYQSGMFPSGNIYWNNKWFAQTSTDHGSIIYEIVIPFSALKYPVENTTWGINFLRNDVARNETFSWTELPVNKDNLDLGATGKLIFSEGLQNKNVQKIILMPSVTTGMKNENGNDSYHANASIDAKIPFNSSLNLDLTTYPDFSNIGVDQQYIDFYRFEYYQPEQRSLFLENNDLFIGFGTYDDFNTSASESRVKPIYTRRIGKNDKSEDIPIIYGARLSGNIMDNTRIGILNIQTEKSGSQEAQNYLIGSFQTGILKRSAIKGLFTSRNANTNFDFQKNDYNRTGGLEFDFSTEDGKWTANAKAHSSFTNNFNSNNMFFGGGFAYFNRVFKIQNSVEHVDKNYITDIGFVPRLYYKDPVFDTTYRFGYTHFTNKLEFFQRLNNNLVIVMGEWVNINNYLNDKNKFNETSIDIGYWSVFNDRSHIILKGIYNRFDLLVPHDVFYNGKPVPTGTYETYGTYFFYETDKSKRFKYNASIEYGGFYKGEKMTLTGGPTYTFQPYGSISLTYNYTQINLKELGEANYHLVGLKPEISFSKKLLWTNLFQYNTQKDNISFNSIFQWRYAPMSDFYVIVKNDANRSWNNKKFEIMLKLTYFLDM